MYEKYWHKATFKFLSSESCLVIFTKNNTVLCFHFMYECMFHVSKWFMLPKMYLSGPCFEKLSSRVIWHRILPGFYHGFQETCDGYCLKVLRRSICNITHIWRAYNSKVAQPSLISIIRVITHRLLLPHSLTPSFIGLLCKFHTYKDLSGNKCPKNYGAPEGTYDLFSIVRERDHIAGELDNLQEGTWSYQEGSQVIIFAGNANIS